MENKTNLYDENEKMKAIIWTNYGDPEVLKLKEVDKPIPKDDEVLVKIHATTVTAGDCEMRSLKFPLLLKFPLKLYNGFKKPKRITILGQELSGEIASVGNDVKHFKVGDEIFSATGFRFGGYAEYVCIPEEKEDIVILKKPVNLSYEESATIPVGGLNALHFMRKGNIQNGQKVLINGAGGSIGTIAIQLAKYFGAEVTGVDSAIKLDMLRSIGADHVIDYKKEDFTKNDTKYDVIFDIVGKASYSGCINVLNKKGIYLIGAPKFSLTLRGLWTSLTSGKKVIGGTASYKNEDLIYLKELFEKGAIKPVIDKSFPLDKVAEAHTYVEKGNKTGNIVIII